MKKTNLKKFLLLFCMLACVLCMTACDSGNGQISSGTAKQEAKEEKVKSASDNMKLWAKDMVTYLDKTDSDTIQADAESSKGLEKINNKAYVINPEGIDSKTIEFYNGWVNTREELGKLVSIDNNISITTSTDTGTLCTISLKASYEKNDDVSFEFVIDDDYKLTSGAINPTYTVGQKMYKAVMNTLIGMGTVFIVLIFISFIISLFKYINKLSDKENKNAKADASSQGVDNAIAQIVSNEENEVDDLELVAVITAAIAASEGTSADGLVVRSIRKVNRRN